MSARTAKRKLLDRIFKAAEVEVECRRSVQASEPQYRVGLVEHLAEAKAGLWAPRGEWVNSQTAVALLKCHEECLAEMRAFLETRCGHTRASSDDEVVVDWVRRQVGRKLKMVQRKRRKRLKS